MPTTINKQRLMNQLLAMSKTSKAPSERPVLEQFLYAICREGVTRQLADQGFRNLQNCFFDWNEIRVSSPRELADVLDMLPDAEGRAQRIIDFLQEVFETTFSFDLDGLDKKGLKQAAKQLSRYQAANDYAVAWVIQQSLGGHAIPLDPPSLRVLRRLGLVEDDHDDLENLRTCVEHQIPKAKGAIFCNLISDLAANFCGENEPRCSSCSIHNLCPTGQETKDPVAVHPTRAKKG